MLHALIVRSTLALVLLLTQASLIQTAQAADALARPTKQLAPDVPYPPGAIIVRVGRGLAHELGSVLVVTLLIATQP